jgi:hypothetical protein
VILIGAIGVTFLSFLWIPSFLCRTFDNFLNTGQGKSGYFLWALWPVFVGYAIRKLPKFQRAYAEFLLFSTFLLPFGMTRIEGQLCLQTTFGYYVAGHFLYDAVGQLFGFFYMSGIALSSLSLLSRFAFRTSRGSELDLFTAVIGFLAAVGYWERFGSERIVNWTILRVSLGFHVMPIMTLIVYATLKRTRKVKNL